VGLVVGNLVLFFLLGGFGGLVGFGICLCGWIIRSRGVNIKKCVSITK